ncbi:MAG: STAS domain-containing protein [candidate division Zixibacteria bacterium]|nr:STAS domain-containing protein [candidate division Zixibacteria bacterium]
MEITIRELNNHKILEISGDIDYFSVSELKSAVFKLINEKTPSIILNLATVEYMDSSGIGMILTAHKAMQVYNGTIGILKVRDDIMSLLKLATVDTFVKIYKSEKELK